MEQNLNKAHAEHSTLVMIARRVTENKIFPGAHETNNDTLKAEGWTKKGNRDEEVNVHNGIG